MDIIIGQSSWPVTPKRRPGGGLTTGFADEPVAEGDDQSRVLGQIDEFHRRRAHGWEAPADERLHSEHGRRAQIHERLIVEFEFVPLEGTVEVVPRPQPPHGPRIVLQVVELDPSPAAFLGPVHGRVGVSQQGGGGVAAADRQGDRHAGRPEDLAVIELEGFRQRGQNAFGGIAGAGGVVHLLEEDGELVAAEAGHRVTGTHRFPDPLGHGRQQVVTAVVAHAVVDELEVVEVEKEDGHVPTARLVGSRTRRPRRLQKPGPPSVVCTIRPSMTSDTGRLAAPVETTPSALMRRA